MLTSVILLTFKYKKKCNDPEHDLVGSTVLEEILAEKKREAGNSDELPAKVAIMKPILRFLQLLCENHNPDLQVCRDF